MRAERKKEKGRGERFLKNGKGRVIEESIAY